MPDCELAVTPQMTAARKTKAGVAVAVVAHTMRRSIRRRATAVVIVATVHTDGTERPPLIPSEESVAEHGARTVRPSVLSTQQLFRERDVTSRRFRTDDLQLRRAVDKVRKISLRKRRRRKRSSRTSTGFKQRVDRFAAARWSKLVTTQNARNLREIMQ